MSCLGPVDDEAISQVDCDLQLKNHLKPIYAHINQYYISEKKLIFCLNNDLFIAQLSPSTSKKPAHLRLRCH